MTRLIVLAAAVGMTGCDLLENTQDVIDGLTNPMVGLGIVLGVAETDEIDTSIIDLEPGLSFSLFLADATSANDLENAPITGADVRFMDEVATDAGEGLYVIEQSTSSYGQGSMADVTIGEGEGSGQMSVQLPPAADFDAVQQHTPQAELSYDLTGQGFDSTIVVVVEVSSGELTYSTEPASASDVYDLTRGDGGVGVVSIPGTAFPEGDEIYLVGITGLNNSESSDVDNMNTVLSSLLAGQMVFQPVSTFQTPAQ